MALVSALVVLPGFVWATVTRQTGWAAWLWAAAMTWVGLWTFLTVRLHRRRQKISNGGTGKQ